MADYGVHKATRKVEYGPYDPLDFEMEPVINPGATFGPGAVADSFPLNVQPATGKVDLAAEGHNRDKRPGPSYGKNPDAPDRI